jgi:AraC family transcriptional regulator, regulatory protein of adaptative response / methylated-DNA-[protein]-cysteine methyltransferase
MRIRFTVVGSPFGLVLVAATDRGICRVGIGHSAGDLGEELVREFPEATIDRADAELGPWVAQIFAHIERADHDLDLPLDLAGTDFQRRVWAALEEIPYGETRSYAEVAGAIGAPKAARAVGAACGKNPVPLVIPCHRVVREDGDLGGFGCGVEVKRRLLERERTGARLAKGDAR